MTYFVVRCGWNSANQPATCYVRRPQNGFQTNRLKLIGIVEADSPEDARSIYSDQCYNNQSLIVTDKPLDIKGLLNEIRSWRENA